MGLSSSHQSVEAKKIPCSKIRWITLDPNAPVCEERQNNIIKIVENVLTNNVINTYVDYHQIFADEDSPSEFRCISDADEEVITMLFNWMKEAYGKDWFQLKGYKYHPEAGDKSCEQVIEIMSKNATFMSQASTEAQHKINAIISGYERKIRLNNKLKGLVTEVIANNFTEDEKQLVGCTKYL